MRLSHYSFDYDYDTHHPCQYGSSCCDDDYCRCGIIENTRVKSVPTESLIAELKESIEKNRKWSDIEDYCIGRLFTSNKLWDTDSYSLKVCGGYYGEEIDGIESDAWDKFVDDVLKMLLLEDDDKIRFVLNEEYGHVLPELQEASFELRLVKYSDIIPPDAYRRTVGNCNDFSSAIGVFKPVGKKYRIIDGHHRWKKSEIFHEVFIITTKE